MEEEATTPAPETRDIVVRAIALNRVEDVSGVEEAVTKSTVVILKVTPLAQKNMKELEVSVDRLYEYAASIGGDIARLGDERVLITPPGIRIWRNPSPPYNLGRKTGEPRNGYPE